MQAILFSAVLSQLLMPTIDPRKNRRSCRTTRTIPVILWINGKEGVCVYVCVCVCVCVCVRARAHTACMRACVCEGGAWKLGRVWMCVHAC